MSSLRLLHSAHPASPSFRHVLEPGNIQTVFQPIVDVATGMIVSAEALSRFSGVRRAHLDEVFAFSLHTAAVRKYFEGSGAAGPHEFVAR